MKKILGTAIAAAASLGVALPAYAQAKVKVCPEGDFANLCTIKAEDIGRVIFNIIIALLIIAAVVAVLFLIWGGIKWVTSGGDKAKVESARNTIIAAIVGLIIAFLAFFIFTVVLSLFGINIVEFELPKFTA